MKKYIIGLLAVLAMLALPFVNASPLGYSHRNAQPPPPPPPLKQPGPGPGQVYMDENVIEIISQNPDLKTLMVAIQAADLASVLEGPGPFTIFAPNNQAFQKLGKDTLNQLLLPENKEKLRQILLYHIVPGKALSTDLQTMSVPTASGKNIDIQVSGSEATVNNVEILDVDMEGSNGVIHVIDSVLIP